MVSWPLLSQEIWPGCKGLVGPAPSGEQSCRQMVNHPRCHPTAHASQVCVQGQPDCAEGLMLAAPRAVAASAGRAMALVCQRVGVAEGG